jgi:hypothetical protein
MHTSNPQPTFGQRTQERITLDSWNAARRRYADQDRATAQERTRGRHN